MIATSTAPMTPAAKASLMAGQTKQRDQLRDALNDQTQDFRLVLVNATGGMGKTRILEEFLARVNHPNEKWHKDGVDPWPEFEKQDRVIVSDLIDVIDTRLHDRTRFITELHNSLRSYSRIDPGIEFRNYRDAEDELRRSSASGVQLVALRDAQDNAAKSFVEDLRMLTDGPNGRRVAVIIDTVERLSYELIDLPYNCGLLPLEAIESRTHVWLAELIKNEKLQNVTLILAGRAEEGEGFFNWIKEAAKTRGIDPLPIELSVLSVDETKEFFQDLEDDFKKDPRAEDPEVKHIAEHFAMMAEDADRLYRYTRGVPVVLSLYGQVIRETATVSRYLTMDSAEALKLAGLEGTSEDTGLQFLRWLIEDSFVDELLKYADFRPEDVSKELAREEELTKPHKSFETRRRILRASVAGPDTRAAWADRRTSPVCTRQYG